MYFQLRKDAKKWLKDVSSSYPLDFDLYYLCLMAGFASQRINPKIPSDDVADLVENFPEKFLSQGGLLVGLLIHTELSRLGIDLEERNSVYQRVKELVDPKSPSYLSNAGVKLMNQYAHGGFDALCESFGDRPTSIETFIRKYAQTLNTLKHP